MHNERSRNLIMLAAFAAGAVTLFFTNAPAELGYGVTAACSFAGFVTGSTIYFVGRRRFLAKKAAELNRDRAL